MWTFLKNTFSKTTAALSQGLGTIFQKKNLPHLQLLQDLEDLLISADFGTQLTQRLIQKLQTKETLQEQDVQKALLDLLVPVLTPCAQPLEPSSEKPWIVLFLGVNGSGKTTTIGKLAHYWNKKYPVRLIGADTFRAGACQQLEVWAQRSGVTFWGPGNRTDPASVIYSGLEDALLKKDEVILIDTAGRLPHRKDLIDELAKIHRIIQKFCPDPTTLQWRNVLVLDATSGQHVLVQVDIFSKALPVSGLIMNKLDACAKGGLLAALAEKYHLPIYGLGTGEQVEDFQSFDPELFLKNVWTHSV